jgi:hypothetical protein
MTRSAHGTQAMRNAAAGVGTNNNAKPTDTSRSAAASASRTNNPHSVAGRPSMFEAGDHDRPPWVQEGKANPGRVAEASL